MWRKKPFKKLFIVVFFLTQAPNFPTLPFSFRFFIDIFFQCNPGVDEYLTKSPENDFYWLTKKLKMRYYKKGFAAPNCWLELRDQAQYWITFMF